MTERQRIALKAMAALAELLAKPGLYDADERTLKSALKVTQSIADGRS